jgi:imidazolonepropionase
MMGETPSLRSTKTLVRGARQLLTLRGPSGPRRGAALGELGIVPDGAVLIRGGKILEAGPSRRLENLGLARGAHEIDATGRVVMPGFVDSRTQPVSTPAVAARRLEAHAQSVLDGMARHGTTTVATSAGGGLDPSEMLTALRMLSGLNGRPLDVIADCHITAPADTEAICTELLPLLARRKLAQMVSVNCEAFDEAVARRILEQAHSLGFRTTVCAKASAGCVRLAIEVQAAAVVLHRLESTGIPDLGLARPVCTLIPPYIYRRRLENAPLRALLEAGAAVALASGFGFEHCPTYNMQMVISLACSEVGMSPAEAISAATINGAHALARGHLCGSIEPSKAADLLLLNVADYRELPAQFGVNHVHMVLKNGHVVYREGEVASWAGQ